MGFSKMGFFKKIGGNGFKWIKLVFFPHRQSNLWDFSFTMCLREIRGICVRRGGRRWGDGVGFGNVGNCD